jgi:hypothetical protein
MVSQSLLVVFPLKGATRGIKMCNEDEAETEPVVIKIPPDETSPGCRR